MKKISWLILTLILCIIQIIPIEAGVSPLQNDPPNMAITASPQSAAAQDYSIPIRIRINDGGGVSFKEFRYTWAAGSQKPSDGWSTAIADQEYEIALSKAGTWYLHIEAWDQSGTQTDQYYGPYTLTIPKINIDYNIHKANLFKTTIPAGESVRIISASDSGAGVKITADTPIAAAEILIENADGTYTKIDDLVLHSKKSEGESTLYQYNIYSYTLPKDLKDGEHKLSIQAKGPGGVIVAADQTIQVYTPIWEDYSSGKLDEIVNPLANVPSKINLSPNTDFMEKNTFRFVTGKYTEKVKVEIGGIVFYLFDSGQISLEPDVNKAAAQLILTEPRAKQFKVNRLNVDTGEHKKSWSFDFYAVKNYPLKNDEDYAVRFTGYDGADEWQTEGSKHNLNPRTKTIFSAAYLLSDFRVVLVRDLRLESFYRDSKGKYPDKPMYVNQMPIDESNFKTAGYGPPGFTSLTKGYLFEFEIDSKNFNEDADTILITPRFYVCTSGIPSSRDSQEKDLYWQNSTHQILKIGEGGHAKWKEVTLRKENRKTHDPNTATWRGQYLIPGTAFAVPKGTTPQQAKVMFEKNTYIRQDIIVNFEIKGYKNGVMKFNYNTEQWGNERGTNPKFPYQIGDVIRYDWKSNNLKDIKSKRNR